MVGDGTLPTDKKVMAEFDRIDAMDDERLINSANDILGEAITSGTGK